MSGPADRRCPECRLDGLWWLDTQPNKVRCDKCWSMFDRIDLCAVEDVVTDYVLVLVGTQEGK